MSVSLCTLLANVTTPISFSKVSCYTKVRRSLSLQRKSEDRAPESAMLPGVARKVSTKQCKYRQHATSLAFGMSVHVHSARYRSCSHRRLKIVSHIILTNCLVSYYTYTQLAIPCALLSIVGWLLYAAGFIVRNFE